MPNLIGKEQQLSNKYVTSHYLQAAYKSIVCRSLKINNDYFYTNL